MKHFLLAQRHLAPTMALFVLLQILLFAPRLNSDGSEYYEYVRSLVIQNDLNFDDEREFYTWEWMPPLKVFAQREWADTGYTENIFSFGPAVFWLPVFFLSHWLILLINLLGGHLSTTGYSLPYRFLPMVLSMTAGIVTILAMDRLGERAGYRPRDRNAALFFILGASHWPAFLFVTPAFSHALSVMLTSLFVLAWLISKDASWKARHFAIFGLLSGFMVMARWQNAFCIILPFLDALAGVATSSSFAIFRKRLARWAAFGIAFLAGVSPQLIVTRILYGAWITDPQGAGGMHWLSPHFSLVLFDGLKGLFTVNPILLPAILLLILTFRRNPRLTWGMVLLFLIQLYINAVRRDPYGVGFGMRRFLNLLPAFTLGLMALFDLVKNRGARVVRWAIMGVGGLLIIWNLLLMGQYYFSRLGAPLLFIGPPGSEPGPAWTAMLPREMFLNQFTLAPRLLWRLIRTGLMGDGITGHAAMLVPGITAIAIIAAVMRWGIPFVNRGTERIFSRPVLFIAILFIAGLDGWLIDTDLNATDYQVINLDTGKQFGHLTHLRLNPVSGYQGIPGGLRLGPGGEMRRLSARITHTPREFLTPGRMTISTGPPIDGDGVWTFRFPDPVPAHALVVISRRIPHPSDPGGTVGFIDVHMGSNPVRSFPIPAVNGDETPSENGIITHRLVRCFPAVNRIINGTAVDVRRKIPLPANEAITGITLRPNHPGDTWEIHGLALAL